MNLSTYLSERRGRLTQLAKTIGAHASEVSTWASGSRQVPAHRCVAIEMATKGVVTRQDLRPSDFQRIWPELEAGRKEASHA